MPHTLHSQWSPPTPMGDPQDYVQGVDESNADFLTEWIRLLALDTPYNVGRVCTQIDNDPTDRCTSRLEGESKADMLERHKNMIAAAL